MNLLVRTPNGDYQWEELQSMYLIDLEAKKLARTDFEKEFEKAAFQSLGKKLINEFGKKIEIYQVLGYAEVMPVFKKLSEAKAWAKKTGIKGPQFQKRVMYNLTAFLMGAKK